MYKTYILPKHAFAHVIRAKKSHRGIYP